MSTEYRVQVLMTHKYIKIVLYAAINELISEMFYDL